MRICLVHEEYPEETNFGGIATYQKCLAEEYVKQGHKVYVIARALKKDQHYINNGVDITRIFVEQTNKQINNYIEYRKRVANELKKLQDKNLIDIIEVPDWGAESVLFEECRKVPLIVRLHTPLLEWLKYNKNNFGEVTNIMLEWENNMLRKANLITCCSSILKKMIVKDFKIPSKDILVTPNPADLKYFYKDETIKKEDRLLFVGSLEERKGVCVLAKALNIFFKSYPKVHIDFIGKDTIRNNKNISTIEYVKKIVKKEYLDNIHFLGQKKQSELNPYYNRSRVAIFPSLFDNFPYVTLEAMATGVQVVGSKNSGMVEMLADKCIYNTPDYKDLAKLIKLKYKESYKNPYNEANIKRVNLLYDTTTVCKNMIRIYQEVISDYKNYYVSNDDIKLVLTKSGINDEIDLIERNVIGVANAVYKVKTKSNQYIIKKYNYKVDFTLSKNLYRKYKAININFVEPINKKIIRVNGNKFNVYDYIDGKSIQKDNIKNLKDFVLVDRETNSKNIIVKKCSHYYNQLIKKVSQDISNEVSVVLKKYESIRNSKLLKERFLNHGDISKTNLIVNEKGVFVIDFDETTIAPMLYDFAVISVKFFMNKGKFNFELYQKFENEIVNNTSYTSEDCKIAIKFYLCKILLEKFWLHTINKINLFSKEQKRDNFKFYFNLLNEI